MALEPPRFISDLDEETSMSVVGHSGTQNAPIFGQISIEDSSDVHFGDKHIYNGPVVIKQLVCDKDSLDFRSAKNKESVESEVASKLSKVDDTAQPEICKGFLWLQNVPKHKPVEIGIFVVTVILFVVVLTAVLVLKHSSNEKSITVVSEEPNDQVNPVKYKSDVDKDAKLKTKLRMVTRVQWVAQPPAGPTTPLVTPVSYVIIHHTATENCSSQAQCVLHVRQIQTFHIESHSWYDIGYNFLVGGDGSAYEGRGWQVEGAHTLGWNKKSIGIAFIGTFTNIPAPDIQISACQKLIKQGVEQGYISKDYKLVAARQLYGTESPGAALYEKIKSWPQWSKDVE